MKLISVICLVSLCLSCTNEYNKDTIANIVQEWQGREFKFPRKEVFSTSTEDTRPLNFVNKYKIITYTDSIGCVPCRMQLKQWSRLANTLDSLTTSRVLVIKYVCPQNITDLKYDLTRDGYRHPVCIDLSDSLNKLNHFPDDERFRCFLLDENNRVILIGNPVQNPKIKDLYIRTICEKLNINYSPKAENTLHKNLGVFSQSETKTVQFEIKNPDKKILKIDSVFTSCECTKAKIDKTEILQNESAVLTVTYKPDGIGDFVREIYVKIHDEEKPKIFEIEGKIE